MSSSSSSSKSNSRSSSWSSTSSSSSSTNTGRCSSGGGNYDGGMVDEHRSTDHYQSSDNDTGDENDHKQQKRRETTNTNDHEHWSWIATSLLLLGHGYIDHAHNLIGPLSFHTDLEFYYGPIQSTSTEILAVASYVHTLVHRREGPYSSEYGLSGYINSNFWAGATLRSGGESTLPLKEIRNQIENLAFSQQQLSQAAQDWFTTNDNDGSFQDCWDPRPLTSLCEMVLPTTTTTTGTGTAAEGGAYHRHHHRHHHHPLLEFAQQAALIELQVLLQHSLTKLGYDVTCNNNDTTTRLCSISSSTRSSSSLLGSTRMMFAPDPAYYSMNQLPKSIDEIKYDRKFQHQCIVVTTATSPHRIVFANKAWEEMCGHSIQDAVGSTLDIIQGPESNIAVASFVAKQCRDTLKAQEVYLVNYASNGERFVNHITMAPLHHQQHQLQQQLPLLYPQYMVAILRRMDYRDRISPAA